MSEPIDSLEMDDFVPYSLLTEDTEGEPTEEGDSEEEDQSQHEESGEEVSSGEGGEDQGSDEGDYSDVYNFLHDQEIFPDSKEKASLIDIQEGLKKAKETLKETVQAEVLGSLPEHWKGAIDYALKGGKDLESYYKTYIQVKTLDEYDLDDDEDQKQIVKAHMRKTTKYTDAKIDSIISRLEESNSLEQEALDAKEELKVLIEKEQEEFDKEQQQKADAMYTSISAAVDKSDTVQEARKGKLKAFLFNPVTRDNVTDTDFNRALRTISRNPEHLVILADILTEYREDKGFSFENITKKEKSSVVKSLKDKLDSISSVKNSVKGSPPVAEADNVPWTYILES